MPESFERLDPRIQQWIWQRGWTSLRDAQERAIAPILDGQLDVVIAAATAAGKTEAAFLPILTRIAQDHDQASLALYVSPLKALINDQFGRLDLLCEQMEIDVYPWHGDISQNRKTRFLRRPRGVLLITPESLEAMFVNRGHTVGHLFRGVSHMVVDELHAFIGSDRGKQIQSLMHRIEHAVGRRIPRVGLSATLGDMRQACDFLRQGQAAAVELIVTPSGDWNVMLEVRGYRRADENPDADPIEENRGEPSELPTATEYTVARHLFDNLRGTNNLIFPNSRRNVELFADLLRQLCDEHRVPIEFWPHHGSLSKALREDAEAALKRGTPPATAVCTSTLEMGIDIGSMQCVAQIGAAPSVASLRQRIGRSGRRAGETAAMRGYVIEQSVGVHSSIPDRLRIGLVQFIAQIELLMLGWFEPPAPEGLHLSALVQQILSVIAQRGGARADQLHQELIERGAFRNVSTEMLLSLLRAMAAKELITQDATGLLLHARLGESKVNHYSFYATFETTEEWTLATAGGVMGTLPVDSPVAMESRLIFGGRRWRVTDIDEPARRVTVVPDPGGSPPVFSGGPGVTHEIVRLRMRDVLQRDDEVQFLDEDAGHLLREGRGYFRVMELHKRYRMDSGGHVFLIPWMGDDALLTLSLLLTQMGFKAEHDGVMIDVDTSKAQGMSVDDALYRVAAMSDAEMAQALVGAANLERGKWDWALTSELLRDNFASHLLSYEAARRCAVLLRSTD